jgi:electron transport complex protein RnfC
MNLSTFKGGTHPYDGKELSKSLPITEVMPKGDIVISMSQHLGAPAKPTVAVGDRVLVGQQIGEAAGFISAHVASSVSGKVKSIESRLMPGGNMAPCIVIENDGLYEAVPSLGAKRDYTKMSKDEIRQAIKDGGVVGMGGAGFPTNVKVTPKDDNAIDYVLVNGAECEPYLTSDYRLMLEQPEKLVGGLKIMLSLFDKAKGIIGIEDNKPDCIEKLTELVKSEPRIEVQPLKTKYPQGAERALIYACTGRSINSTMLPADAGCVVDNVYTVISIYNAVALTTPVIGRVVTITGDCITKPQNFWVKLGTNFNELVEAAGGYKTEPEKIISGGPMMGMAMFSTDVPVTKTSGSLLTMSHDEVAAQEPTACIRCGRCVEACPSHLVPQIMVEYAERNDIDGFKRVGGMECYECGSCTYVCPAKRRLTQSFKQARAEGRKRK